MHTIHTARALIPCRSSCFVSHKILSSVCCQQKPSCTDALPAEEGPFVFLTSLNSNVFRWFASLQRFQFQMIRLCSACTHNEYVEGWPNWKIRSWKAGAVFSMLTTPVSFILGFFSVQNYFWRKQVTRFPFELCYLLCVIVQFHDRKIEGNVLCLARKNGHIILNNARRLLARFVESIPFCRCDSRLIESFFLTQLSLHVPWK